MDKPLGKLEKVELREYWNDEAGDFTPWLAREENLKPLADTLGIDLELVGTEQNVEEFSADIVARDPDSGELVIIENQLEGTDHDHLGKLITYASGLGANTVVWVAREIRDAHRQAINWLNEVTSEKIRLFALEMELWRIGASDPGPKFNVVCKPNDWGKRIKDTTSGQAAAETEKLRLDFWTGFVDFCNEKGTMLKLRHPSARDQYSISLGRTGVRLALRPRPQLHAVRCGVYTEGEHSADTFQQLQAEKTSLEAELGTLDWRPPKEPSARGRIDSRTLRTWIVGVPGVSYSPGSKTAQKRSTRRFLPG